MIFHLASIFLNPLTVMFSKLLMQNIKINPYKPSERRKAFASPSHLMMRPEVMD